MSNSQIQRIWQFSYGEYTSSGSFQSDIQRKASYAVLNCKSGRLGVNISQCPDCGHIEVRNNSCRNRNCPSCQAVNKEIWVDKRRAEVIDAPYFHVVFTTPPRIKQPLLLQPAAPLWAAPQMLRRNTPGTVRRSKIPRCSPRHHPGTPYLGSGDALPCTYALHYLWRRAHPGP